MPRQRYTLIDPELLRVLMRSARDGRPISVRDLGDAARVSKSKLYGLLNGALPYVDAAAATRIAEAVGVPARRIFHPALSTSTDAYTR